MQDLVVKNCRLDTLPQHHTVITIPTPQGLLVPLAQKVQLDLKVLQELPALQAILVIKGFQDNLVHLAPKVPQAQ